MVREIERDQDLSPHSLEFWTELGNDLDRVEPRTMTLKGFVTSYHPERNPFAKPWINGKYSYLWYQTYGERVQDGKVTVEEFLATAFAPPTDDPQFQEAVRAARELIEYRLKRPRGGA
ncbi:hypothetical protein A3D03_01495 [Candidatus Gottesmanbacteria bacterium RIFCSPHIGHO2_02_FULL_40_13]|uniref:Uncharacterized protein n=1 Tax=Candidatus Gottesmanbacteria bacterium RIFCSPHIGHO2_02_FULL_40_13 TaxID=1798384 RepID=A0A1F6AB02_9BACT|nr:MAG: hypothetical protein A3D03_01495 [Candidatus Gottesmanbacteria bacterium RIFCSPHIGHO2_02_FULL_40_13]